MRDILLLPIGGVSQMERIPEAPADEFAIAIAGPLTSLGLGVACVLGGLALHARLWPPTLVAGEWFARLAWLNFLLGGFNLLPALPMDGGRVLRAGLAGGLGRREATRLAGRIARAIAVALIVGGVLYDFWLALIGVFVFLGSNAEEQAAQTSARHEDRRDEHDQHRPPADRSCDPTSPR